MKAIVVVDENWGIGKNNDLLFSLPLDMKHFRENTLNKVLVMGSNTLKSFPNGPLKNRVNIVLYPNGEKRDDCVIVDSLDELKNTLKSYNPDDVFVVGGAMMYKTMLPFCSEIIVTKVNANGNATVFFTNLDQNDNFNVISESDELETNNYKIKFVTYKNNDVKIF